MDTKLLHVLIVATTVTVASSILCSALLKIKFQAAHKRGSITYLWSHGRHTSVTTLRVADQR